MSAVPEVVHGRMGRGETSGIVVPGLRHRCSRSLGRQRDCGRVAGVSTAEDTGAGEAGLLRSLLTFIQ